MGSIPWILIAVAVLIIILGVAAVLIKRKHNRPPDYYAFFIIGLIWTIFGLPFSQDGNYAFFAMGLVFLIVGLVNKDKWEKNRVRWKDLSEGEKKLKLGLIIFLGILVLAGLVAYYLVEGGL